MNYLLNLKLLILLITLMVFACHSDKKKATFSENIKFEETNGEETSTYNEVIQYYKTISKHSSKITMQAFGKTDSGQPLYVVSLIADKSDKNSVINLMINNGIHPGESDGIDASMLLLKDIVNEKIKLPDNINLHIIPVYNVGGMLNRNSTSRANQNGPKAYGFRGNAKNYDLNRDFIKMDSKNMQTFAEIFHHFKPDVFVETHVSNGADYQYTLTHLFTQHNRLGYDLGSYLEKEFKPSIEKGLLEKKHSITPYVNVFGTTPEQGFSQFVDYPRYSTGYTSLWNTLGLMIETHMLKPYNKRVIATKDMLETIIYTASTNADDIISTRETTSEKFMKAEYYKFNFKVDSLHFDLLNFNGYEAETVESSITGKSRLKYDRNKPFTKPVKYFNNFIAQDSVKIPKYYIVKSSWDKVIHKLDANNINYNTIQRDTLINVESYSISDYNTYSSAYEGHYPHYNTKVTSTLTELLFTKGDVLIPVRQEGIKYIMETLEPEMNDSFFNWNSFDTILQQKEGFSAYVFEDYASVFLKNNPEIKAEFEALKANDEAFKNNAQAQLNWIYKNSPLYEEAHLHYPVYRVLY